MSGRLRAGSRTDRPASSGFRGGKPPVLSRIARNVIAVALLPALLPAWAQADDGEEGKPSESASETQKLDPVIVHAPHFQQVGPMPGLEISIDQMPGNVQGINAHEIAGSHALGLTDLMNSRLQSVNVNDYAGNPFQMDLTYRGFTASPQIGTAQGLSIFLDGIRVNEPFGDVINWDLIPINALADVDMVPGSNPLFGLGTLGGALAMRTRSGFDNPGSRAEVLGGSFGRSQLQASSGGHDDHFAGFFAVNLFNEHGARQASPSRVDQGFGKVEWRDDQTQIGLSTLLARDVLIGNGTIPVQLANQDPSQVFTAPDQTTNRLGQFQLALQHFFSDEFNITGQVYHRTSLRHGHTADINQDFNGYATRRPVSGEVIAPEYASTNTYGIPDYSVLPINVAADANGMPLDTNGVAMYIATGSTFSANPASNGIPLTGTSANQLASTSQATVQAVDANGNPLTDAAGNPVMVPSWTSRLGPSAGTGTNFAAPGYTVNGQLPANYASYAKQYWNQLVLGQGGTPNLSFNGGSYTGFINGYSGLNGYYTDAQGFTHQVYLLAPIADPGNAQPLAPGNHGVTVLGKPWIIPVLSANGSYVYRDGGSPDAAGVGTGYVDGTPTAILTDSEVDQEGKGLSLQLNWNGTRHKAMLGLSMDHADATYASSQMLGLLDDAHVAYADPAALGAEYFGATDPIPQNAFDGTSFTRSLYAADTWTPREGLSVTGALRYNHTRMRNALAVNRLSGIQTPTAYQNSYALAVLCPSQDPSSCPADTLYSFDPYLMSQDYLGAPTTEYFNYHSLNPAIGATLATGRDATLFGNLSQGARTPSVVELGCGYDNSPVQIGTDAHGNPVYGPRSSLQRTTCNLPNTLSGDPYLPQVVARTLELGGRGHLRPGLDWNLSLYDTELQDDIYFVTASPGHSYFQDVGRSRRRGLEAGLHGQDGTLSWRLNYSLTDATFQSSFWMDSPNNSTAGTVYSPSESAHYQQIQVTPGDRMPGVPLHNLNAGLEWHATHAWILGLDVVAHSAAYVRGNENNRHQPGPATPLSTYCYINGDPTTSAPCQLARADFTTPGMTGAYAVFNFHTSWEAQHGITLGLQVNNLLDRRYDTAAQLGLNPFSPSIHGLIGPSGFNYNSTDWLSTTFVSPAAPRAWFGTVTIETDTPSR